MTAFSRRRILQAIGAAGVGTALASPAAMADGDSTPFCPDCPEGTSLLAKYDWDESTESFVFVDGVCDVVSFGPVGLDDDGEPVDVSWQSDLYYEGLRTKYSTACDAFTREETRTDEPGKDGVYEGRVTKDDLSDCKAISYIAFCATPCFQVDFVFGPAIDNLGNDDGGFYKARKIAHLWGNPLTGHLSGTSSVTKERDGCTVSTGGITADLSSNTASVEFTVDGTDCELTLVSYVAPCPIGFTEPTGDQQSKFDAHTETVDAGKTFTVDLPTAADLGALCEEFGGSIA